MKKVWTLAPNENWICDVMVSEWNSNNPDLACNDPRAADVIWLLADWAWKQVSWELLQDKVVLTTIHHIVPEKFGPAEINDFQMRDRITNYYHVYNERTYNFIRSLTMKPIVFLPYWANQNTWKLSLSKLELKQQYNLPDNKFIIGSFQRDTEGADLVSPKLEKGPDLLADFLIKKSQINPDVHVLLAGWRRQYIIKRLQQAKINYSYFERPSQNIVNDLYQTLDLYAVSARHEGGPQALIECGLLNIPVVSTPVGIAEQVLPDYAISNDISLAEPEVPNVKNMMLPHGFEPYRKFFTSL